MTAHVEGAAPPPLNLEARGAVARVLLVAFNVAENILKGVSPAGARGGQNGPLMRLAQGTGACTPRPPGLCGAQRFPALPEVRHDPPLFPS